MTDPKLILSLAFLLASLNQSVDARSPLSVSVDLNVGESVQVKLVDGSDVSVKLLDLEERLDSVNQAVREARVTVEVDGEAVKLVSAAYHLPVAIGKVQIDCPITKGYNNKGSVGSWGLDKAARLRLWPAGSPWIAPGTFQYPAVQKWFATDTQMANEPVHVDGGERPNKTNIYYHSGLDIGGSEGLVDIVAATDGLVVSSKAFTLPEHKNDTPVSPRYDVVYLLDDRGWYYRYSHLKEIARGIKPGVRVTKGDPIGVLGKEGGSGGWTHLHFEIKSRQPSGKWGTEEGYAFLWESYRRQYQPAVIAVARPHHLIWTGETVTLDGSKSEARDGGIATYEWQFEDGSKAKGPTVERSYGRPGRHTEILKVTDGKGNVAYDFPVTIVYDREHPDRHVHTIHANYAPTFGIQVDDPVTFKVRSFIPFGSRDGKEIWNFGDGSPEITVQSDGNAEKLSPNGYASTIHSFKQAGDYVIRVQRVDEDGVRATGKLWVQVAP